MKIVTAAVVGFFGILVVFYCLLQLYVRPFPAGQRAESVRTTVDRTFWSAWVKQDASARWLYRTVFRNSDKIVFFPPRVVTEYGGKGKITGYIIYGKVTAWDWQQKLLTVSSYTGGTLYVRFDPPADVQTAILPVLDNHGSIIESKPVQMVTSLPVPHMETLFCPQDVLEIGMLTRQELFSSSPARPLIPTRLVLSFRLCQNTP